MTAPHFNVEVCHGIDDVQPGADGSLGIVLVSLRIAEEHQYPIAYEALSEATEALNGTHAGVPVRPDHFTHVLGIKLLGKRRGARKIAKHHRELSTLGFSCELGSFAVRKLRDGVEQDASVPKRKPEVLQVLVRQHSYGAEIDVVLVENGRVLAKPYLAEPQCQVGHERTREIVQTKGRGRYSRSTCASSERVPGILWLP